ncbi:LysM peptidoglycan-binding domain-containing protein [Paenibacillus cymbidii]|uniref:LysM peptidoglycan-binding domain-containing protein n=1 Tax=Paenibacillus cymbidii TaxID=1639034 RepID=UPI00107FF453|nr:LysM peptidoglycan-binding domain-containing protein [Paenibacillus cymbidii]
MPIYTVQSGDNLWRIARQFGVGPERIVAANELAEPGRLAVGQTLYVPPPYPLHEVQQGETLAAIASRYGVTADAIARANGIANPGSIAPGQVLVIPALYHTVQRGDTLWRIAQRYGVQPQAIQQANNIAAPAIIYEGQTLRIPERPKPVIEVNAYVARFGEEGAELVRRDGIHFTYVCPFAYRIRSDGGLTPVDDEPLIAAAYERRVVPLLAITNFSSTEAGSQLAHTILTSEALKEELMANALAVMQEKGYLGLNVDFENVLPEDREAYNQFLRLAAEQLHPHGYSLSTALAPKTGPNQKGLLYEAHDYPAHGEITDFVVLMTYEWGYRAGPPQPISPINEIRRVLDYAVTVIPPRKILMGFQLYARDWLLPHVQGQTAETFSMQEALRRALQYGVEIRFDTKSQTPYYRYTDAQGRAHEVWFEDARSAQAKFDLVKEYGLRGVCYWELGYPFPQNWALLEANFTVRKLL